MSRITIQEVKGWLETTKFPITNLDTDLLDQLEFEVLGRVGSTYDTTLWIDEASTPRLVRVAIAKMYAGWLYHRAYSEEEGTTNAHAQLLWDNAELLITGIIGGAIDLPDALPQPESGTGGPSFYPNDASSAEPASWDDGSLGPNKFSMGQVF